MSRPIRFAAPAVAALALILGVAACSSTAAPSAITPSRSAPAASATPTPAPDPAALAAYTEAMCPIFQDVLAVEPRIADLREAAADGGDVQDSTDEMAAVSDDLLAVLTDLEAVPEWGPGGPLRYYLISSLHGIRTTLLRVEREPGARGASDLIAELPFISSDAMDRAFGDATSAGFECGTAS
jgi:hypothetical protein